MCLGISVHTVTHIKSLLTCRHHIYTLNRFQDDDVHLRNKTLYTVLKDAKGSTDPTPYLRVFDAAVISVYHKR